MKLGSILDGSEENAGNNDYLVSESSKEIKRNSVQPYLTHYAAWIDQLLTAPFFRYPNKSWIR